MLVIVMDKESNFGKQGSDISINDVLEKVKNLPEDTRVITSSELEHINAKNDMAVTSEASVTEALGEHARDLENALKMYTKALNDGNEKDRYKLQYHDNGVTMKKLESFRKSIYRELRKHEDLELPLRYIKGMNKTAVSFINDKKQQRFKDGIRLYEDLLAWIKKSSESSCEMRAKIWFNLATAYQKGPELNHEKRKKALIEGFNESPEGTAIKDRVLSVINRDYSGLVS